MTADTQPIAAEAYLTRLAERGIDYVFANAGTDFAPIVEALSRSPGSNRRYPKFITVPHENVAMAMAHGYYRIAGKPAVVMCHVTVGTANCINGLMNATRDNVPILLAAGRTPLTETGHRPDGPRRQAGRIRGSGAVPALKCRLLHQRHGAAGRWRAVGAVGFANASALARLGQTDCHRQCPFVGVKRSS